MGGDDDESPTRNHPPRTSYRIADPDQPIQRDAPSGTYVPFSESDSSDELPAAVLEELTDEVVDGFLRDLAIGMAPDQDDPHPTPPTTLARTHPEADATWTSTPPTPQHRVVHPTPAPIDDGPDPVAERVPDLLDLFATPVHPTPEREFPRIEALAPEPSAPTPVPGPPRVSKEEPQLPEAPAEPAGLLARIWAAIRGLFG